MCSIAVNQIEARFICNEFTNKSIQSGEMRVFQALPADTPFPSYTPLHMLTGAALVEILGLLPSVTNGCVWVSRRLMAHGDIPQDTILFVVTLKGLPHDKEGN